MAHNDDPRSRRTRGRLLAAFRALADEGGVGGVTVRELVERAGVTRGSFYSHFASTSDLAAAALTEVFEIVASMDSASRRDASATAMRISEDSLREVVDFIDERRAVYGALLAQRDEFALAIEDAFAASAAATLAARGVTSARIDVTARFIAAGAMGVISWWLRTDSPITPGELAAELSAIIPADFTQ